MLNAYLLISYRFSKKMNHALSKKYKKGVKISKEGYRGRSNTDSKPPSSLRSEIELVDRVNDVVEIERKENYWSITPYIQQREINKILSEYLF